MKLPSLRRVLTVLLALAGAWAAGVRPTLAQSSITRGDSLLQSTHLIEFTPATPLSLKVRGVRHGGIESFHGQWISFDRWYTPDWHDMRLSWMTQLDANWGAIWGLSTGERAPKYAIEPGLKLGFIYRTDLGRNESLSVTGTTVIGGRLRERTCEGNYGALGGIQTVNCRLAATTLQPAETLNHLYDEKPESALRIQYRYFFK